MRHRVLHERAQAPPLECEQSLARPALARDHLSGQRLDPRVTGSGWKRF
jgi:hypothetical protein